LRNASMGANHVDSADDTSEEAEHSVSGGDDDDADNVAPAAVAAPNGDEIAGDDKDNVECNGDHNGSNDSGNHNVRKAGASDAPDDSGNCGSHLNCSNPES